MTKLMELIKEAPERFKTSEEEFNYLTTTKAKNTFRNLVGFSKPLFKAFFETKPNPEDLVMKANANNLKEIKKEFVESLNKNKKFIELWHKKWHNGDNLLLNVFHTLVWYHHQK